MEAPELLGRERELAAVDAFVERARAGAAALVLEGEAGIGKSALWREVARRAESGGLAVLSSRPAEAEAKLSYSALADLLEHVGAEELASLPGPQRRALEVALLREDAGTGAVDGRAVSVGLRGVLVSLAGRSPVLVAIDDTQWLDAASARAVAFALRRVEGAPVSLLAARRALRPGPDRLEVAEAELLQLGGLSLAATHELLKRRLGRSLPRPLLVRLHEACRGNPFFALEVAREVLHSGVGPGAPLPVPKDLRRLVRRRLGRLSALTRETLLVAAATAAPTRALLASAVGSDVSPALEEAERADVIELERDRARFSHPLYPAVVYGAAPAERRRLLHRRLGELVADREERARHLALAADAPSGELAAALDEAAEQALRRGAPAAAAELSELALRYTPTGDDLRQERALRLGEHLTLAADSSRAREVLRAALPTLTTPARRVRALLALGELVYWSATSSAWSEHDNPIAYDTRAVAEAAGDGALEARARTALATYLESDAAAAQRHAGLALEAIEAGARVPATVHAQALCALARSKLFQGGGLEVAAVEQAVRLEAGAPPRVVSDRSSCKLGQWLKYVDEFDRSRSLLERARQEADDEGDDFSLVDILINLVILECWAGRWPAARALGEELAQRFLQLGYEHPGPHVALVAALTGDGETVERLLSLAPWDGVLEVIRLRPLGLLALSRGEFEAAFRHYSPALERLERGGIREPAVFRIHGDAVESAIRAGHLDEGARAAASLAAHAKRSAIPWNTAIAARSDALVAAAHGDLDGALGAADAALRAHERLPMPFELGRTLLVRGEIERRAKRKAAAKASLARSLAIFEELGAPLWAARVREELGRVALRRAAGDELTESERRVAELAASGLTNREVAARLFMSAKTVEATLARAYRKLGIRSRAELGARLGGERAPAQT